MADQTEVNNYVTALRQELVYFGNRLADRTQQGHKPVTQKQIKFKLLQAFNEVAEWYLDEWDDTVNNGMTVAEFNDIQQHINKIGNSFHWIDLS
jgi:hypothetical protein